jgi:TIR- and PNP-associating SLOG family
MTTSSSLTGPLLRRRIQIAGSASAKTESALVNYGHDVVRVLVKGIMAAGGGIVVGIGKEPRPEGAAPDAPSLLFDWTALETAAECLKAGFPKWPTESGLPLVVASSEKGVLEIPDDRRSLYEELLATGLLHVESIMAGSRSAAFIRQRQATFGDALLILGGGSGVEHSADLYLSRRKPVVPFDLSLGASREDGTGGAMRLAKEAKADPTRFVRFRSEYAGTEGAALAQIAMRNGAAAAVDVADKATTLLSRVEQPYAFYVRLLKTDLPEFPAVEAFFRDVVDPVVEEAGMRRVEMGASKTEHAFMNVAIFEGVHFSSLTIVDVTGERPNCFIELGYALRGGRILAMAQEGTKLPFDQQTIPCHFWKPGDTVAGKKKALIDFWEKNINRPAIVKMA